MKNRLSVSVPNVQSGGIIRIDPVTRRSLVDLRTRLDQVAHEPHSLLDAVAFAVCAVRLHFFSQGGLLREHMDINHELYDIVRADIAREYLLLAGQAAVQAKFAAETT